MRPHTPHPQQEGPTVTPAATRTRITLTLVASGVLLVLASVAYACVPQLGDLQLSVPYGQDANLVTGANAAALQYCAGREPTRSAQALETNEIVVQVRPASACQDGGNQLPDGEHLIIVNNDGAYEFVDGRWQVVPGGGCFAEAPFLGEQLGTLTVTDGRGATPFPLDLTDAQANGPGDSSLLCIGNGDVGIFAPLQVTTL